MEDGDKVLMAPSCPESIKLHTSCFHEKEVVFEKDGSDVFPCDCGVFHPAEGVMEGLFALEEESAPTDPGASPCLTVATPITSTWPVLGEMGTAKRVPSPSPAAVLEACPDFAEPKTSALAVVNGTVALRPVDTTKTVPSLMSMGLDPRSLAVRFTRLDLLSRDEASLVMRRCKAALDGESNILHVKGETVVVGDLHGQFFDLLRMIRTCGEPPGRQYVFLGDYVDRGQFSCEVALYLMSLKVCFPDKVFLLRGNHETRNQTATCGFERECRGKYGMEIYEHFIQCFMALPLAATLSQEGQEKSLFCVHGGISPRLRTLDDILAIDRRVEPEEASLLADLLWSDPSDDESLKRWSTSCPPEWSPSRRDVTACSPSSLSSSAIPTPCKRREVEACPESEDGRRDDPRASPCDSSSTAGFRRNLARGCSWSYDRSAAYAFLEANSLRGILRAHSVQGEGYYRHFEEGDRATSRGEGVATVFSAPKYTCHENKGAVFVVRKDGIVDALGYDATPEPPIVNRARDAVQRACPFMPTSLREWAALETCRLSQQLKEVVADKTIKRDTFTSQESLALRLLWEAMSAGEGVVSEATLFSFDDTFGDGSCCLEAGATLRVLSPTGQATAGDFLMIARTLKIAHGVKGAVVRPEAAEDSFEPTQNGIP